MADFRHIAIEGPVAVGKCTLTERLAGRLDAAVVLDDTENPFLEDFYAGRPGAALQAQIYSLLARHRQQAALRQSDLFHRLTVSDYLFDKDKIYACLNLDDNDLYIYQRLFDVLAPDVVTPDLVIYLQTPTDILRKRARGVEGAGPVGAGPDDRYLGALNEAYHHFFFHYEAAPLLVVETSDSDLSWGDRALDDLLKQIDGMDRRTRYYVPHTTAP